MDLVEDAVDKFAGIMIAVFLGQLDRFIDRNFGRDVTVEFQFIKPHAQDIAVNDRHAVKLPVRGILTQFLVNIRQMGINTQDDLGGKVTHLFGMFLLLLPE